MDSPKLRDADSHAIKGTISKQRFLMSTHCLVRPHVALHQWGSDRGSVATRNDTIWRVCPLWSSRTWVREKVWPGRWVSPSGTCYWDNSPKRSCAHEREAGGKPRSDVEGWRARYVMNRSPNTKGRTIRKQNKYSRGGRRQVRSDFMNSVHW